jgi:hypothetical protein
MATKTADPGPTLNQLIDVVRTSNIIEGVPKMRALATLQRRDERGARDLLMEVVADRQEAPRFRHMAAMGLYARGGTRANEALSLAAEHADELSAPTIAMGLGRVGTSDRLAIVERLVSVAAPYAKDRAEFAATLLTYRHHLDGHVVRAPAGRALQNLDGRRSQTIEVDKARANVAARALEGLADEPLDIDLTTESALRMVCEPNTFVWLWTKNTAADGFSVLARQKGMAGVLFRKRPFENAYALSAIGLGTPMRGGVRLTLHRASSGMIMYSGQVAADGTVELRARNYPGLAAVEFSGRVDAGKVELRSAKSAAVVREAKKPKRS